MKRLAIHIIVSLLTLTHFAAAAQITTKYGDNVSTLDGIVKAYYDVVTVKKGGKVYYERDSLLHWPNVSVGWPKIAEDGKKSFNYVSLKEYHRRSDPLLEKQVLMNARYPARWNTLALFTTYSAPTNRGMKLRGRLLIAA